MKRYCFALDLKNDPALIREYEAIHKNIWPDIRESIVAAGILRMDIYRTGDRMFMIMDTVDNFSFEEKSAMDLANPRVQEWENFMWKFQQPLPHSPPGTKWVLMDQIFSLD